jgi:MFS family permease
VLVGLAGSIWTAGWTLPQLLSANIFGRNPRNKPYMRLSAVGRLLLWSIPICLWGGLADHHPTLMLIVFFAAMGAFATCDGLTAVSWFDFMAREIPPNRRGRLQGIGQTAGGLASVGVGALIALILARLPYPSSYTLIFALAAIAFMPGGIAILLLREHVTQDAASRSEHMSAGGWFRPLKRDADFRRLVVCRILYGLTALASSFYVGHAVDVLLLPERLIGQFTVAQTVTKIICGTLFGLVCDRWGPLWVVKTGILLTALGPAFALLAHLIDTPQMHGLYPIVFIALGISQGTFVMGISQYLIGMAPETVRPAYIGLANSIGGISSLWPIVGGWLLNVTSYPLLFSLTTAMTLLAFLFSLRLHPTPAGGADITPGDGLPAQAAS